MLPRSSDASPGANQPSKTTQVCTPSFNSHFKARATVSFAGVVSVVTQCFGEVLRDHPNNAYKEGQARTCLCYV